MTAPLECAQLRDQVEVLSVTLALWAGRDDAKAQPEVRQAANRAVEQIDAALLELYRIRQQLVGEIRESDDAAMRRSEALLAKHREERS